MEGIEVRIQDILDGGTLDERMKVQDDDVDEVPFPSPRGVLEITATGSDADNNAGAGGEGEGEGGGEGESESGDSPKAFGPEKPAAKPTQFKKLFDNAKMKSVRRFAAIPLLAGYELSRKSLRKLERNRSVDETIDCGDFIVQKPSWRNFSRQELAAATDDFSPERMVGKGGHAEVYRGTLPDGEEVAVKKIMKREKNDEDRAGDFLSELGIIAHIDHPNAAKLIGFSVDGDLHLVLQFSPHGSLASLLHGDDEKVIEWSIRLKVAIGVAEGLQYLHSGCKRRIIHRDITASNILLTQDYDPQISDFGLAKWLPEKWVHHVVHPIEGTFGYMAPEYFMHGIVDEKTDVFAFGVLLLELITGRRALDSSSMSLVMWAKPLLEKNCIKELVDPRLEGSYDEEEMKRAMVAALACLHHSPGNRPLMVIVVELLVNGEGENKEIKPIKSRGGSSTTIMLDPSDHLENYTTTTYLNDLSRHMQLVLE
ncbi:receptor-like cytosolic serine/threonine-protein kinase RBK1 [Impatiens glandulifera]|uniref:receptor-like cytosolic serine/threonine-protein kinase RBK1 n=1 Tax=Impatiens glandulifera TaxID=253017 RepID=UPI001FB1307B|nr:receptor-like cytosolic serine/threonine-protein kinase RBK1 [Impatiens glandulifera]